MAGVRRPLPRTVCRDDAEASRSRVPAWRQALRPGRRESGCDSGSGGVGEAPGRRVAPWRSVFESAPQKGVDGSGSGPYIGVIDGGAACERPAGFDASELISGVQRPAGFAGCVVVFPVRRFGAGRTFGGLGCPALFDNCIGRKRNVDGGVLAARFGEHCAAMRGERHSDDVTFPDSSRSGFRAGADVFGTRREVWPSGRA